MTETALSTGTVPTGDPAAEQSIVPSIENIAAGLVTAAVDSTDTGTKALAAVEHGAETFVAHNTALVPVLDDATSLVSNLAAKHGVSTVWAFFEDLFPFLEKLGTHSVALPNPYAGAQPQS